MNYDKQINKVIMDFYSFIVSQYILKTNVINDALISVVVLV